MPIEVTRTTPDRLPALCSILGRAFVHEPEVRWSLGAHGDIAKRCAQWLEWFYEPLVPLGLVWEAGDAQGVAVCIPPDAGEAIRARACSS